MHDVPHLWQGLGEASPKVFEWAYVCTLLHTAKSLLWCESIGLSPGAVHRSFLSLFLSRGPHPPPAGPTQLSRVTPTGGGRRPRLTNEGCLTRLELDFQEAAVLLPQHYAALDTWPHM